MLTLLNLLSAIALLVWGTHIVRTGILRVYGSQLRRILSHSVAKRPQAFAAGIGVTALVQSSNATAMLVTSFVAQGLMGLAPALAIMLGADVGTALMARVLTLDLSWLSPLLIFAGVVLFLSRKQRRAGQVGRVAIGLGLLLLALNLIVEAARPIAESNSLEALFASLTGDLLLDALVGALFALLTYSSLAAVLLTATLASSGMISLPVAIGLVIGANIGSGVLALLNSSMQSAAGRRVAIGSLLYKLLGLLLVLPLVTPLVNWMDGLELSAASLVIGFHLLYNSLRCLLMLPTVNLMARLCTLLLPERKSAEGVAEPRHLDRSALDTPSLALANAVRETLRIGDLIEQMLGHLQEVLREGSSEAGRQLRRLDDDVDALYSAVKLYLAQMPREDLAGHDSRRWAEIIELAVNLEHAGDLIEQMAGKLDNHKRSRHYSFSASGLEELTGLLGLLQDNLRLGLNVFLNGNPANAQRLIAEKRRFRQEERKLAHAHVGRLSQQVVQSIETSALHLELIADMKRLNSLFCSSAYALVEALEVQPEAAPTTPQEPPLASSDENPSSVAPPTQH
ncbi:Na/Pi cotransporter family protein [Pseudomonas sp. J452]|uniref:Na/Pi cotransporter family protein n=1 Tax=Pseudomonas sp. J452 TaxID=2898441 RepID=UPI0021ADBBBD|nr:Na/Pi cotransporter family protein [Pseudomonas sp. J452]UUY09370.1 Na/Pi cotransporter family protein [Pseudomonas sp. J452]